MRCQGCAWPLPTLVACSRGYKHSILRDNPLLHLLAALCCFANLLIRLAHWRYCFESLPNHVEIAQMYILCPPRAKQLLLPPKSLSCHAAFLILSMRFPNYFGSWPNLKDGLTYRAVSMSFC